MYSEYSTCILLFIFIVPTRRYIVNIVRDDSFIVNRALKGENTRHFLL